MTPELRRAVARYDAARLTAHRQAGLTMSVVTGVPLRISEWSNKAREAYEKQWLPHEPDFDWPPIFDKFHKQIDRLEIVVWCGDRLAALSACTAENASVVLRYIEGDPRPDCPLKGLRLPVVFEAATIYAQARGKKELRLNPANSSLESLYRDTYGFQIETPWRVPVWYRKEVP